MLKNIYVSAEYFDCKGKNDVEKTKMLLVAEGLTAQSGIDLSKKNDYNRSDLRKFYQKDLDWIITKAEGLFLLDGWETDAKCRLELALAQNLDLRIFIQNGQEIKPIVKKIKGEKLVLNY